MLCRGTLPAIVFTVTIPGMLGVTGEILSIASYGSKNGAGVEAFKIAMLSWSMAAVCAVAAVATRVAFIRLEAVDGAGRAIELPLPSDERTAPTRIPVLRQRHHGGTGRAAAKLQNRSDRGCPVRMAQVHRERPVGAPARLQRLPDGLFNPVELL